MTRTKLPVPAAMLGAARTPVSRCDFASFGDVVFLTGNGIAVRGGADVLPGPPAWSPPS